LRAKRGRLSRPGGPGVGPTGPGEGAGSRGPGSRASRLLARAVTCLSLAVAGCDEDPVPVADRVWCVEQESRSLLALPLGEPACASRGYLSEVYGPLAFDVDERLLAVDLLARRLVELQPDDGFVTPLFSLDQAVDPRALCVAPGGRLFLLDAGSRVLQVDPATGAWVRSWALRPEGDWRGLAWLPAATQGANGEALAAGTLLAWRPLGEGGELAWLETTESEALAHVLMGTPSLGGLDTSRRRAALYGLDPATGDLYRLRPDLRLYEQVQAFPCDPFAVTDIALP